MQFSLFFFSNETLSRDSEPYKLLWDAARFADSNGFTAIWTPERHFSNFGASFPAPSLTSAALSMITTKIQIRAGSVVLPLHHPIRVAEEWALLDQFSKGRIGLCFASGWHPQDFVFAPAHFQDRHKVMLSSFSMIQKLWKGESVEALTGDKKAVPIQTYPKPFQQEIPIWFAASGNPHTYILAGEQKVGVLTHLLNQSVEQLGSKLALYREKIAHFPNAKPHVVLMLHTFLGEDMESVRQIVFDPLRNYLKTALTLELSQNEDLKNNEEELELILDLATERYIQQSGLFGSPKDCLEKIEVFTQMGVDEIACFIDFGVEESIVLKHLPYINTLKNFTLAIR